MTSEIIDCLLIKAKFATNTKEEMVEEVNTNSNEDIMISIISEIMMIDHFFFSSDKMIEKLEYFIDKIRYKKKYNTEITDYLNEIIFNINIYKGKSKEDQKCIQNDWLYQEEEFHMLPHSKKINDNMMYEIIKLDYFYINALVNHFNQIEIIDSVNFLMSINLLANQYMVIFQEHPMLIDALITILPQLQKSISIHHYFLYSKMEKETIKKLYQIKEAFNEISDSNYQYQIEIEKKKRKD